MTDLLRHVKPGDLIKAELMNELIDRLNDPVGYKMPSLLGRITNDAISDLSSILDVTGNQISVVCLQKDLSVTTALWNISHFNVFSNVMNAPRILSQDPSSGFLLKQGNTVTLLLLMEYGD